MATYPVKVLKDESGTPFVPLVSADAMVYSDGITLAEKLDKKLEATNIKGGNNVSITTKEGDVEIGITLPESINIIDNLTTESPGQGALDARQGKVLKDSIPQVINNTTTIDDKSALSAYQGYLLSHKVVPEGGTTGQVLKKSGDGNHELEWGDAADPNAIIGDGSIASIIELSYKDYKNLEASGNLEQDTEYHINDVNDGYIATTSASQIVLADNRTVEMAIEELEETQNEIFIVEYTLNFNPLGITTISATQQEIVDAYNEGKKVIFYGSVVGSNVNLISELNTIDNGLPYTYPFLRTDLGEGIYNYFFRIGVYMEFGTVEAYALVDTNKLNKTEETFNQTMANIANSRPTTEVVQAMVGYLIHEEFLARENRLLPENVEEGTILKYVDGKWTAVEDDTFTVDYQLNPETMEITEISHYSTDIIEAYNSGKTVNFRCYVLGLGVYVSSDLNLIDGTVVYTMPIIRGDLGQGMMNYLFRVGIRTGSTFVEVRILQDIE